MAPVASEVLLLALLAALLLGYPLPLAAVQILWINLVTEGMLAVNLIMEPLEENEMRQPPVPAQERLITGTMRLRRALRVPASVGLWVEEARKLPARWVGLRPRFLVGGS